MEIINNYFGQKFYVYNEDGCLLGVKDRKQVHRDGDWHRGVQLNLFYQGLLLLQRRSGSVDLSPYRWDQSLATQLVVEDEEDDMRALGRGLWQEFELDISKLKIQRKAGPVKIVKTYLEDPDYYNREIIYLYEAELSSSNIKATSHKIGEIAWLPVHVIKEHITQEPLEFTQTFRMWLQEAM